eukprot:c18339_g1_i4.p1 GENE.c18339_g1_i4~~c18339_g1_i4.p1  ORF type:complete len:104 (-),score=13.61 c18339_g1_i4:173-484(-)
MVEFDLNSSRAMVFALQRQLRLPMVALVDWNPYGLAVMFAYKFGGIQTAFDGQNYPLPVELLGLRFDHVQQLGLLRLPGAPTPMTTQDFLHSKGWTTSTRLIR